MRERILKFLMVKGVRIFTDYVPTRIIKQVSGCDVDHIELRNNLNTIARIAAKHSWKDVL
jgi:hypothetical protein